MAKRISSSSVNWALIAERIIPEERATFNALKSKSDKFLRQVTVQPAELPKIDWDAYKSKISKPGFVENFQKSYEGVKIPYPSDQGLLAIRDKDEADSSVIVAKMQKESASKLESYKQKLATLEAMKKYSEMTIEEFMIAKPEFRISEDNPRLFPQFIDTEPEYDERNPPPPIPDH